MGTVFRRTAIAVASVAASFVLAISSARAQALGPSNPDPLAAARALFAEALRDEGAGRFRAALEKFERVRAVRDTAAIEYRIGTCHDGLEEPALAFRAYRASLELSGRDPQSADIARAASDGLRALAPRVALLFLVMPAMPASYRAGVDLRVDGLPVTPVTADSIPLAPGPHVVTATTLGVTPFRSEISLAAGAQIALTVVLAIPFPSEDAPLPRKTASAAGAWLAIGGGVASLAAATILFVLRHDDIAALNRACPGGACPAGADANDLETTRRRALLEGPLSAASGVVGIAALGLGAYVLARGQSARAIGSSLLLVPVVAPRGAGVAFGGAFR